MKTEAAKLEAGGELDALVAVKVMGWEVYGSVGSVTQEFYNKWLKRFKKREENVLYLDNVGRLSRYSVKLTAADENEEPQSEDWSPSTDIRAAMEIVAKMGGGFALHWRPGSMALGEGLGAWFASFGLPGTDAETAPLAICRAALVTVERGTAI